MRDASLKKICDDINSIKDNIRIEQKWVAQNGDVIILASVLANELEETKTIFKTDSQSKSFLTQKWLGYHEFGGGRTKVVIVPSKTIEEQDEIKNSFAHERFTYSKRKVAVKRKTRAMLKNNASHQLPKPTFSFGTIGKKLVWMNREQRLLQYCDLDEMAAYAEKKKGLAEIFRQVDCTTINLEAFYSIEFISQIQS